MQPDELERRLVEKREKSQWRSRRKVDAVKCKWFARRRFVYYWCVHFFPTMQGHYLCSEENPTPRRDKEY
jgi:hypothetical protein